MKPFQYSYAPPPLPKAVRPNTITSNYNIPAPIPTPGHNNGLISSKSAPAGKSYSEATKPCFESCKVNQQKDEMEKVLKKIIGDATKSGELHLKDWTIFPIPNVGQYPERNESKKKKKNKNKAKNQIENVENKTNSMQDMLKKRKNVKQNEEEQRKAERAKRFQKDEQERLDEMRIRNSRIAPVKEQSRFGKEIPSVNVSKSQIHNRKAPDPSTVRPLAVLKKSLAFLKKKWREECDYGYICDQFKSLRQDLTVQRIKNEFTVQVYEIHARIALEKGDLGEYNQCQTQLKQLYNIHSIKGNDMEFLAYRLLYLLHTKNRRELKPVQKENLAVSHALKVKSAISISDYYSLSQLYNEAPNMGVYLMDHFMPRERYRPNIDVSYICKVLAFESTSECLKFLQELDLILVENYKLLDTKSSLPSLMSKFSEFSIVDIKGQI
ncbi:SAC3/GANP/Nin1/mts3/eIF-3 p25 domain-containing protein [Rozella allomycis CSF55]|uniref:SAC3/GANP/Nin1/mts3/eIF-3 p25 domain-containing protein n=1 Tax=Rozella allomycis (strain CSF55) TaxID=988480 RepID=A0A075AP35_ROZAC|nr:SAC3/GANP/Nin1/mts3/eIF-3 p25 domain-containing protein [Rozella allomycis CSF55]|eukprot:EPZ31771.1 SAC3/GANP/Nin1/mts3/eIF-3 p25 domain-containing protein [Rozella allomycis CSF55]